MGGYGSGSWSRQNVKLKTNLLLSVDIRFLKRKSLLIPDTSAVLNWEKQGVLAGSVAYSAEKDHVFLEYEYRPREGPSRSISEPIWLDYTPCNFGSKRVWFNCSECNKRVAIIYGGDKGFLCRKCCDLTYQTQCWDALNRSGHKAQKIRKRLGGSGALGEDFPSRPKGMHFTTYCRLLQKGVQADRRFWGLANEKVDKLQT